jgi:outer membrane biosynthesis protein TonB
MRRHAVLAVLITLGTASVATEAPNPPQYSLRSDVDVRARFGPATAAWSAVPFNRTYAQLTDEQKALVKSVYVAMDDQDEPPYPEAGLEAIYGPIAEAQGHLGIRGELDLEVIVSSNGSAEEVRVYRSPHKKVTQFVANLAMLTRFKPALCAHQPCRMSFPIRARFGVE